MEKALLNKYKSKAADSFKTKLDLFLFEMIINNKILNEDEIRNNAFYKFEIRKDLLRIYVNEYWQMEDNFEQKINELTASDIYYKMKEWKNDPQNRKLISDLKQKYVNDDFKSIFPLAEFEELCLGNKCYYCNITTDKISELISRKQLYKKHITRGWSLEIDRKKPNLEYTRENSVLCCYWCNNAKTDEFCDKEFSQIGIEIEKVWNKRLSRI